VESQIWGNRSLESYTQVGDSCLRRWIGLYGFPRGVKIRIGSRFANTWEKSQVDSWMASNAELVDRYRNPALKSVIKRRKIFTGAQVE
jgi:predicted DNA-binding transcriptional regulator AlpA